ncbi:hypothetical protein BKA62DRAFT_708110 [Auriculariales sp. MPI-PUGE-AT-0066]|nr:hypothetical protein BKA62DRAFT_708110 [Auriculariales sp. MPI-PUGE-AT-0066]
MIYYSDTRAALPRHSREKLVARQDGSLTIPPGGGNVNFTIGSLSPRPYETSQDYLNAIEPCQNMQAGTEQGWINGTLAFSMRLSQTYNLAPLVREVELSNARVSQLVFHGLRFDPHTEDAYIVKTVPTLLLGADTSAANDGLPFDVRVWEVQPVAGGQKPVCARVTYTIDLKNTRFREGGDKIDHLFFRDPQDPPSDGDRMGVTAMWAVVESQSVLPTISTSSVTSTSPISSQKSGKTGSVSAGILIAALITPAMCALLGLGIFCFLRRCKRHRKQQYVESKPLPGRYTQHPGAVSFVTEPQYVSSPLLIHPPPPPRIFPLGKSDIARVYVETPPLTSPSPPTTILDGSNSSDGRGCAHHTNPVGSSISGGISPESQGYPIYEPHRPLDSSAVSGAPHNLKADDPRMNELVCAMEAAGYTVDTLFDQLNRRPSISGMSGGGMPMLPGYHPLNERNI